jgi:NADP-dependent 3-hydroxy acid dehydrogenase YdfG
MVMRGARRLVLLGRTQLPERARWREVPADTREGQAIAEVRALEAMGASVHLGAVDVADGASLHAFLEQYRREGWPAIRGVMHAAGVAVPQMLDQIGDDDFRSGLGAKAMGGWLLHQAFADEELDFFVLFSSVAGIGFSMGMGVYAAGNAFMDGLAQYRAGRGLPATSILWGPWATVGMATQEDVARDFEKRGFHLITPEVGMQVMDHVFGTRPTIRVVLGADWVRQNQTNYPAGVPMMLKGLVDAAEADRAVAAPAAGQGRTVMQKLHAAEAVDRQAILQDVLRDLAARSMRLDVAHIGPDVPLNSLGLDSIISVELKNRIDAQLGTSPSIVEILKGGSVGSLAEILLPRLVFDAPVVEEAGVGVDELALELAGLSDDDLEALLRGGA